MLAFLLALLADGEPDRVIRLRPVVEVTGEAVTLADVAESADLPAALRARASQVVLARLSPGASVQVAPGRLIERARAQLPMLAGWAAEDGAPVLLHRRASTGPAEAGGFTHCARLLRPIAGGAFVEAEALEPAACVAGWVRSATWFDRSAGLVRASRTLPEGAVIGAPPKTALARYAPGQPFTLSATVGPVRIERPVEAVRPAAEGAAVAVRDADGKIHVLTAKEEARP